MYSKKKIQIILFINGIVSLKQIQNTTFKYDHALLETVTMYTGGFIECWHVYEQS